MRRNTRLKRSKAGWFPRVPRALFSDARYRGYERAERYRREGLDHVEKRWGIYLKWHRLDPRRPPKDLFPRRAALSVEKRGSRAVLPLPSFLPLYIYVCFIYIYMCFLLSFLPFLYNIDDDPLNRTRIND